ncbi:hypothetical protein [Fusibacter sp. JL216-2]|uniref:hypothetical protein n=1 Tax=Fusibacter sp. JL216-2 TaxID=3071453 RepID=UPI003D349545
MLRRKEQILVMLLVVNLYIYRDVVFPKIQAFFGNLSNPLYASVYTLIVTLVYISGTYYFSTRQEREAFERKRFQMLYLPLVNKLFGYFDVKTAFRRGHDVKDNISESDIENEVIEHISRNIYYSSSALMSEYISINRHDYFDDFKGDVFNIDFMELCEILLKDVLILNKDHKLFDRNIEKKIRHYHWKYSVFNIVNNCSDCDATTVEFMTWNWQFKTLNQLRFYWLKFACTLLLKLNKKKAATDLVIDTLAHDKESQNLYKRILFELD